MKVFVWHSIDKASDNYHSDGGVVVFAETEERARELAAAKGAKIGVDEAPDDVRTLHALERKEEACYIMPNAGCC